MKLDEYLKYFDLIQGSQTYFELTGESIDKISILRVKGSIAYARVAQHAGRIKQARHLEFLRLRSIGDKSIRDCELEAEAKIDSGLEVCKDDVDTLLAGVEHFMNACSGRQKALEAEFRGTQRGEI